MSENDNKVMSNRGEMVDFDLLRMKSEMSGVPKTIEVVNREKFIDKKRRKGSSRKIKDMVKSQAENQRYVAENLKNKPSSVTTEPEIVLEKSEINTETPVAQTETSIARYKKRKQE